MKLITKAQRERLIRNGAANQGRETTQDFHPVVKLFTPDANCTWLLTELDPDEPDIAFGLCDLGYPELGIVSISELERARGPMGLRIERDLNFEAAHPLSVYAAAARSAGCIVDPP